MALGHGTGICQRGICGIAGGILAMALSFVAQTPGFAQTVTGPAELGAALAQAQAGQVITLGPADYGVLVLDGLGGKADAPITLRGAKGAVLRGLSARGAHDLHLENLTFDYVYRAGDAGNLRPFVLQDCRDLVLRGAVFDGDLAPDSAGVAAGYPTGFGLSVTDCAGVTVADSEIRLFLRGIVVSRSSDVTLTGNTLHAIRSDGINMAQVARVLIARNTLRDFLRTTATGDHSDMIQFWTNKTDAPSHDITIRENVLNSGAGLYTQSIFMRNEAVEKGAGAGMFYRNLRIEQNVIINAHLHGISIGQTDGLVIARNTLLRNPASAGLENNPALWTPQIRVNPDARHVQITGNVVAKIAGAAGQGDWQVADNLFIQDHDPSAAGYYDTLFQNARMGDPRNLASFAYRRVGPLDGAGIGADLLGDPGIRNGQSPAMGQVAAIRTTALGGGRFRFDASANRPPQGVAPDAMRMVWQMDDGQMLTGAVVEHHFETAGLHRVSLAVEMPDLPVVSGETAVLIQGADVVSYDAATGGLLAWANGTARQIALPAGAERTQGLALGDGAAPVVLRPRDMPGFFGAADFRLDLRLRARASKSPAGEVLRIHQNLILTQNRFGMIELAFTPASGETLRLAARSGLDKPGEWQEISVDFNGARGDIRLIINGALADQAAVTGRTKAQEYWGLSLGNPFANKPSFAGELALLRLRAHADATATGG